MQSKIGDEKKTKSFHRDLCLTASKFRQQGSCPKALAGHTLTAVDDNTVYLLGGATSDGITSDMFKLAVGMPQRLFCECQRLFCAERCLCSRQAHPCGRGSNQRTQDHHRFLATQVCMCWLCFQIQHHPRVMMFYALSPVVEGHCPLMSLTAKAEKTIRAILAAIFVSLWRPSQARIF